MAIGWDGTTASVDVATVTATSPMLPGVKGSITGFHADNGGFSITSASLTSATPIKLGGFLEVSTPTVSATGLSYATATSALTGTVGLSFSGARVFPGSTAFSTTVTNFKGSYNLTTQETAITADTIGVMVGSGSNGSSTADPIFAVTANTVAFKLTPNADGTDDSVELTIGSATATLNKFANVNGSLTNLKITNDGFSVGSATLNANSVTPDSNGNRAITAFGGKFSVLNPKVTLTNFGYSISTGTFTSPSLSLSADEVDFNKQPGAKATVAATALTTSISFAAGDVGHFKLTAGTVTVGLGSFLNLVGPGSTSTPPPPPGRTTLTSPA